MPDPKLYRIEKPGVSTYPVGSVVTDADLKREDLDLKELTGKKAIVAYDNAVKEPPMPKPTATADPRTHEAVPVTNETPAPAAVTGTAAPTVRVTG